MRAIVAFLKCCSFALHVLWISALQPLMLAITKGPKAYILTHMFQNAWRMSFSVRLRVVGTPADDKQVIYMANHLSYLDIPALASVIKNASFVAKSEVEGWPLAGFLAGLQQTEYVQRKRSKIAAEKNTLQERLDRGDSLIIFPEGTSTSGYEVIPFKSSLFMLAMGDNNDKLYVQPVTIRLAEVNGKTPETKDDRDLYAWPRDVDIDLHHHLWRFAKTKGATLEIIFHEPLKASEYDNRKVLAKDCYEKVAKGLEVR